MNVRHAWHVTLWIISWQKEVHFQTPPTGDVDRFATYTTASSWRDKFRPKIKDEQLGFDIDFDMFNWHLQGQILLNFKQKSHSIFKSLCYSKNYIVGGCANRRDQPSFLKSANQQNGRECEGRFVPPENRNWWQCRMLARHCHGSLNQHMYYNSNSFDQQVASFRNTDK